MARHREDERPRWRSGDEEDDDRPDWENEPEEEQEDRHPVLGGTAPLARMVFLGVLLVVVLGGILLFIRALAAWSGR